MRTDGARRLVRRLNQFGISHRYEEFPDNHTSVDYRTDESLPFLVCVVRASRLCHGPALRKSDWQKIPMRKAHQAVLELAGREVVITNPDKPFFPQAGHTKLHLVRYYAAVAGVGPSRCTMLRAATSQASTATSRASGA